MLRDLNPEKALIFRITHRDNIPWVIAHGLHCRNSNVFDPNYVEIGNSDLIQKRHHHPVRHAMGGTLSDYVPFYFTPLSPMLYNIKTGWNGIRQRPNEEIVILVSSLHRLRELDIPFVFSDMHAYMKAAQFSSDLTDLGRIDWNILQLKDFERDQNDLGKMDRYMAEALVRDSMPVESLLELVCYNKEAESPLKTLIEGAGVPLKTVVRAAWYF